MIFPKPKAISFREKVKDIKKSTYLTHSLYYHPAKFIPQIVRFCLDKYTKKGRSCFRPVCWLWNYGCRSIYTGL